MFAFATAASSSFLTLLFISIFLSDSQGFRKQSHLSSSPQKTRSRGVVPSIWSLGSGFNDTLSGADNFIVEDVGTTLRSNHSTIQAKFIGSTYIASEPVSVPAENGAIDFMADFFKYEEHRNLLFPTEGHTNSITDLGVPTEAQRNHIGSISQGIFSSPALTNEVQCNILEIKSAGINFAGLKVNTLNTMASQLVLRCTDQQHEYRFMLLSSKIWAEGPKPMVWLFKKLTASDYINEEEGLIVPKEQMSYSFTRLWAEQDDDKQVVFNINATLEVRVNIPKVMMRLLPMKFEKFEKQGSAAIQRLLDRDLQQSIKRLKERYIKWIAS